MFVLKFTVNDVRHELDMEKFMVSEADALLKFTGWKKAEWVTQLLEDHPDGIRFAYWLVAKRAGTPVEGPFRDIDFDLGTLDVDFETDAQPEAADDAAGEGDAVTPTGSNVEPALG